MRRAFSTVGFLLLFGLQASAYTCQSLFDRSSAVPSWVVEVRNTVFNRVIGVNLKTVYEKHLHQGYLTKSSHTMRLENSLGFRLGKDPHVPALIEIVNKYNKFMNDLVSNGLVAESDILSPVMVIQLKDKSYSNLKVGEELPAGATFVTIVPEPFYSQIIAEGKFPLTKQLFEHDLAHFTAFMDHPLFMQLFRKFFVDKVQGKIVEYKSRAYRESFLFEGLVVFNENMKADMMNHLLLSQSMKENPQLITLEAMQIYLQSLPKDKVQDMLVHFQKNFDSYFQVLGGSARDMYNKKVKDNEFVFNTVPDLVEKAIETQDLAQIARLQIIILKWSQISLADWFLAVRDQEVNKNNPVAQLFNDKALWLDHYLFLIFSDSDYVREEKQ
ncbi:MAG: hypothetical protein V4654_03045 [Bdellovibrionota bacterium]